MNELFVASKNSDLANYLELVLNDIWPNKTWTVAEKFSKNVSLVVFDIESNDFVDFENYQSDIPVLLFCIQIKPLLLHYTKKYYISGIVSFEMSKEDIKKTFEAVANNDIFYSNRMVSMLFSNTINEQSSLVASLTDRENEILVMMMNDFTNEEIANNLDVSVRTINAHKGNIMRKVGAKTTSGLIKIVTDFSAILKTRL